MTLGQRMTVCSSSVATSDGGARLDKNPVTVKSHPIVAGKTTAVFGLPDPMVRTI